MEMFARGGAGEGGAGEGGAVNKLYEKGNDEAPGADNFLEYLEIPLLTRGP